MNTPAQPNPHQNEPVDHPPAHPDLASQQSSQPVQSIQVPTSTPTDGHFVQTDVAPAAPPPSGPKTGPMRKIMLLSLFILFLAFLGVGGWWAYENVYLSPEKITAKALEKTQQLKNYKYDFNLNVTSQQSSEPVDDLASLTQLFQGLPANISLTGKGQTDVSDKQNTKITGEFELKTSFFIGFNFEARIIGSDIYVKPSGSLPSNLIPGLEQVNQSWIKISSADFAKNTPSSDQITQITQELPQLYTQMPFIKFEERLDNQTLDDQKMRHYRYSIDEANLTKVLQQFDLAQNQASLEGLSFKGGEIWIGVFDSLIHKTTFDATYTLPGTQTQFKLKIDFHIYDFDQEVVVSVPDIVVDLNTIFTKQYSQARDAQRRADLLQITNTIYHYAANNNGNLPDTDGNPNDSNFPTQATCIGTDPECFNLAAAGESEIIVPTYIAAIPSDPQTGSEQNTQYFIHVDTNGMLVATAKSEDGQDITVQR